MSGGRLPLQGLRVIAVEQYGAGPFGSLHLADLGADVIKIEDPAVGGDVGRFTPPYTTGTQPGTQAGAEDRGPDSLFFQSINRNKRSVVLDVRNPSGREVFERLVANADAVYSNLRGDVPEKLGITYRQLAHVNPRIVCCSLSGFGMSGPRRSQPGYDYLLQGLAGWMSLTGAPDGPPTKSGASLVDFAGGVTAALALLAGVHGARETGIGTDCDVSLYDTAISMLNYLAAWHLTAGHEPARTANSAHPSLVPFQNFRTADSWIVVACPKEKFWRRLVTALGEPEWGADPRFGDFAGRADHREEVLGLVQKALIARTTAEWLPLLEEHGVPCARVNTVPEALAEEHSAARGLVLEVDHPVWGRVRQVATAARVGEPRDRHRRAPALGEDNGAVLTDLCGYTPREQDALRAAGAFGTTEN
ncbi:CaiB/BaiF CoA transferase family protein [Actinomadura rugatobispora]|uniref:CaiB/BaiF CoA transferase family protein n=1 Tax=Actinomadura rugatobispora TaxID=1994 RepID=A0ABW0ZZQ9_9ACTN|nr:CaiB/BaiF CoA-transferase family protein [Actinomadura rugatobispora]